MCICVCMCMRGCVCAGPDLCISLQYDAYGRNITATVMRDLEIANVVDAVRVAIFVEMKS